VLVLCADAGARARHLRTRLGGFSLASHDALGRGAASTAGFPHVVLLDPPAGRAEHSRAMDGRPPERTLLAWGPAELRFAKHIHEQEHGLRDPLAACYRTLRDRGGAAGEDLEAVLRGDGPQSRSPELAGRLLRVLAEIGLVELDRERAAVAVTERRRASLEASPAFREYERRRQDGLTSLRASIRQAA
jgi:single-stranded-DNA-specific exonuclease